MGVAYESYEYEFLLRGEPAVQMCIILSFTCQWELGMDDCSPPAGCSEPASALPGLLAQSWGMAAAL